MKWLDFELLEPPLDLNYKPKTNRWVVWNKKYYPRIDLGTIRWHNPWRQYVFFPYTETLYSLSCLREISEFIAESMESRNTQD